MSRSSGYSSRDDVRMEVLGQPRRFPGNTTLEYRPNLVRGATPFQFNRPMTQPRRSVLARRRSSAASDVGDAPVVTPAPAPMERASTIPLLTAQGQQSEENHAAQIVSEMEKDTALMEDNPVETLREMPESLTMKRSIKRKLVKSVSLKSRRSPLSLWKQLKYRISMSAMKLWYSSMKQIEGHFGSGVATYFRFLRWLFVLNSVVFLVRSVNLVPSLYYDMGPAYFFSMLACYLFIFITLSVSMARSYRKTFIETTGDLKNVFAHKVFCGWDFSIATSEAAVLKSKSVYNEMTELLEDLNREDDEQTWRDCLTKFSLRAFLNLFVIVLLIGTGVLMHELYVNPRTELFVTLVRTFAMEVVVIGVIVGYWLSVKLTSECWETSLGQAVYRLVIIDFLLAVVGTSLAEFVRYYVFNPLLAFIIVLKFFITFYVKKGENFWLRSFPRKRISLRNNPGCIPGPTGGQGCFLGHYQVPSEARCSCRHSSCYVAQRRMVNILREMLVLEARDKEFLLRSISRVTEGQWMYNLKSEKHEQGEHMRSGYRPLGGRHQQPSTSAGPSNHPLDYRMHGGLRERRY
ncbi:hypothetical protein C0J52_01475 [Blattella germanica]|nr:hypothetical protein C0J52_01475 [Blattella germanica]